jgi:hypothetical protein
MRSRTKIGIVALMCAVAMSAVPVSGAGRGKVTTRTHPVNAGVSIDGKRIGDAPIAVTLEGAHEIAFLDYNSQYITPPVRAVRVGAGDSTIVSGYYRNRFVPDALPAGFAPADSLRIYGTKERNLKDGTIFDYIDGGAMVYLRHGLRETTHAVWKGPGKTTLTLDIFDMGTPSGAQAAFDDNEICPSGFQRPEIGAPSKSYRFEPDYILYFHAANWFVNVATNNDSLKAAVDAFAASVYGRIPPRENER